MDFRVLGPLSEGVAVAKCGIGSEAGIISSRKDCTAARRGSSINLPSRRSLVALGSFDIFSALVWILGFYTVPFCKVAPESAVGEWGVISLLE